MNKKVKFLSVAASMALAASLGTPALAANVGAVPYTGGTDVYAGVTTDANASKTNLKVTVPTLFSFVVVGSADDGEVVSENNGNLLLPNVQVDDAGKVSTVGQSQLYFTNYSTSTASGSAAGQAVTVTGAVMAESGSKWKYVAAVPGDQSTDAYEYRLSLKALQANGTWGEADYFDALQGDGSYACDTGVTLAGPTVGTDGVAADGTAKVGMTQAISIGVEVGGKAQDYNNTSTNQPSAKVGTIVWTISAQ